MKKRVLEELEALGYGLWSWAESQLQKYRTQPSIEPEEWPDE
jgi:hypothetical protein